MGAQRWACSERSICINFLDRIKSNLMSFLVEPILYCLYLSNSHHDRPLLILGEIELFQLFYEVVFDVVFRSLEVVGVWSRSRAFYFVDATTSYALYSHSHLLNFAPHLHFLGMRSIHSNFGGGWRAQYQHSSS